MNIKLKILLSFLALGGGTAAAAHTKTVNDENFDQFVRGFDFVFVVFQYNPIAIIQLKTHIIQLAKKRGVKIGIARASFEKSTGLRARFIAITEKNDILIHVPSDANNYGSIQKTDKMSVTNAYNSLMGSHQINSNKGELDDLMNQLDAQIDSDLEKNGI